MRKLALTFLTLTIITGAFAQVPQALNYQAVARNSLGQIVPSQNIGVRFTITDAAGNITHYQETHTTTTNNFGLFTLAIGKGTAVSGTIPSIDWSTGGDKYLKVEIAPQGGTNYTIQGTTQLLSVPYALYSEKTKLVGGNAITITNGNTINANYLAGNAITITGNSIAANYLAGPGINITGNTISATAVNSWLVNGNAGTTAANFLGTTDNLPVNFRTNNIHRLSISESSIIGSNNVSYIIAGQQSNFNTNPVSLAVYGKDISGSLLPFGVATNIAGMNFDPAGGSNNTLGRQVRWSQWPNNSNFIFYDQGIDQEGDYYITEQGLSGTGGSFPKKMLQISATDNVGINMAWAENPTANFHTKGTLRFEGVNTNNTFTRILAMDANGNVASRDASTLTGGGSGWLLTGNSGTTAANFLGTTDNQRINFRTNNITRMYLDQSIPAFGADLGHLSLSSEADIAIRPSQLSIFGRDIAGATMPALFVSYVGGATWGTAGGNTSGRFFRLSQMNTTFVQSHFYDVGMSQDSSFYIGDHGFQNVGGVLAKKMFTISPQDMVGINLDMSEKPKARLHVKNGDIYLDQVDSGVIMKSPNGQCWRMTVSNAGAPVFTAIPCP